LLTLAAGAVLATLSFSAAPAAASSPPGISGTPTSPVHVGTPYTGGYTVTGDPAPTTSVTAGALPDGLAIDDTGAITGTPTAPGTFPFTVTATNGVPDDAHVDGTIVVLPQDPTITGTPPPGEVWLPYSFTFATTGTPTVSVVSGALPIWATLAPDGTLSGKPSRAGISTFTVQADNGSGNPATTTVSVTVQPKPRVTITDASVPEGNSGLVPMTFTVHLSRTGLAPVTMHWWTSNGTARAATDYKAASGSLTIPAGQTAQTVAVLVRGDRTKERNETLLVNLRGPSHADLLDGQGRGVIVNDD
jgi:hypothetical protein